MATPPPPQLQPASESLPPPPVAVPVEAPPPVAGIVEAPPPPQPVAAALPPQLTDDLLAEIFLRVADPGDLVSAAAAHPPFLRIIADPEFARRFRRLHPPSLLGFVGYGEFQPVEPPHLSAPAALAVAQAADFSFAFLPPTTERLDRWMPLDVSDGRALMADFPMPPKEGFYFSDLLVCDPLFRRYALLPPIPKDLAACVHQDSVDSIFLVPADEGQEETSFRVVFMAQHANSLATFIYSSRTGQWQAVPFHGWSALLGEPYRAACLFTSRDYACGCFYWELLGENKLLVLDTGSMEFSTVNLPPMNNMQHIRVVDAGLGRPVISVFRSDIGNYESPLGYTIRQNEGDDTNQWQLEKTILYPMNCECFVIGAAKGCIFLRFIVGAYESMNLEEDDLVLESVSLDMKTLEFQRIGVNYSPTRSRPYFGYPPLLSTPGV